MEERSVLTVSQVVDVYNMSFDAVGTLTVEGEVSDFRVVHGKWVTFSLKDAESTLPCFMPVWQLKVPVEDGMLVRVLGKARIRNKGFLSFVLEAVRPAGEGSLKRAFELLQQKLSDEGIFATERKRPLPKFPQHIALITSREAAAYNDFLKVLTGRHGGLTISFIHTQVQGDDAARQVVEALEIANTELANLDVIVLVRGGGSLEDLHVFNDEIVVRAVAGSRTPTIVGIGHERDVSLAELAADVRASTPSNAAELLVQSRTELLGALEGFVFRMHKRVWEELQRQQSTVQRQTHALGGRLRMTIQEVSMLIHALQVMRQRLSREVAGKQERIIEWRDSVLGQYRRAQQEYSQDVSQLARVLRTLSPEAVLRRGFSITRTQSGQLVTSGKHVKPGEDLIVRVRDGEIWAEVTGKG